MSNIRLYQIGRTAGNVDTSSADTTLTADLSAQPPENEVELVEVQDITQITSSDDLTYILIDSEIISGWTTGTIAGFTADSLVVEKRGALGTSVESHDSGSNVYVVNDPDNATDGIVYVKDEINNFRVHDVGTVEKAVEHEKGQFRINNMNMTISGVQPNRLKAVGSIQKPWVVEIKNDQGTVIFSGFVKEGAKYNAGTEKINLKAVSWLEILSRSGDIPARAVYETEVFDAKRVTEGEGDLAIEIIDDPRLTSGSTTVGDKNDTIAIESDVGELRRLILEAETFDIENSDRSLRRMYVSISDALGDPIINTLDSEISNQTINAKGVQDAYNWAGQLLINTTKIYYRIPANKVIDRMAEFSPWDKGDYRALLFDSNDRLVQTIVFEEQPKYTEQDGITGLTIKQEMRTANLNTNFVENHSYYLIVKNKGNEDIIEKVSRVDRSDKAVLFAQDAWGYPGETENGYMTRYDSSKLIDNLMTVNDTSEGSPLTGVLSDIYGGTTFDIGGTKEDQWDEIDPRVRFPTDPMEALRMIQQTSGFLVVEDTSTQSNGSGDTIPEVSYRILPRARMTGNSVDEVSADITSNVLSWKENVTEKDINAVVVEPNEQYRGGGDVKEALGWYYEGIDEDENTDKPDKTTRPKGDDVIEIETNTMPSHEGVVYSGGSEEIRNDTKLKAIARKYYTHFSKANREVQIEVGRDNPDVLGKVVTFDEGNIDHRALITSKNFEVEDGHRKTTLEGRIAGKGFEFETDPTAIINGSNVFHADSNDDITVRLSGINSYDEASGTLSYSWDISGVTGTISGPQLNHTLSGITSRQTRDVTLTVTNNSTGRSGSATKEVVFEPYTGPINAPNSNEVSFDKTQLTINGDRKGRLKINPRNNTSIAQDSNDNYLVQYIAKIGGEVPDSYVESDWITIGSSDTDEDITGETGVESRVVRNTDGFPKRFEVDVPLARKHVSNILVRIKWNDSTGFQDQINSYTFDFDRVAQIRSLNVSLNANDTVVYSTSADEDTDEIDVYVDGGLYETLTASNGPFVGRSTSRTLAPNEEATVRVEPINNSNGQNGEPVSGTVSFSDTPLEGPQASNLNVYADSGNSVTFDVSFNAQVDAYSYEVDVGDNGTLNGSNSSNVIGAPTTVTKDSGAAIAPGEKVRVRVTPEDSSGTTGATIETLFINSIDGDNIPEISHLNAFYDGEVKFNVSFDDDVTDYDYEVFVDGISRGEVIDNIPTNTPPSAETVSTGETVDVGKSIRVVVEPDGNTETQVESQFYLGIDADQIAEIVNLNPYRNAGGNVAFDVGVDNDTTDITYEIYDSRGDTTPLTSGSTTASGPKTLTVDTTQDATPGEDYFVKVYPQGDGPNGDAAVAVLKPSVDADTIPEITNASLYKNNTGDLEFSYGVDDDVDYIRWDISGTDIAGSTDNYIDISGPATDVKTLTQYASVGETYTLKIRPNGKTAQEVKRKLKVGIDADQEPEVININPYNDTGDLRIEIAIDDDVNGYDWWVTGDHTVASPSSPNEATTVGPAVDDLYAGSMTLGNELTVHVQPDGGNEFTQQFKYAIDSDLVPEVYSVNVNYNRSTNEIEFNAGFDDDVESFRYRTTVNGSTNAYSTSQNVNGPASLTVSTSRSASVGDIVAVEIEPSGNGQTGPVAKAEKRVGIDGDNIPEISGLETYLNGNGSIQIAFGIDDDVKSWEYEISGDVSNSVSNTQTDETGPAYNTVDSNKQLLYGQSATVTVTVYDQTGQSGAQNSQSSEVELGVNEARDQFSVQTWQDQIPPDGGPPEGVLDIIPDDNAQIKDVYYRKKSGGELTKVQKEKTQYTTTEGQGSADFVDKDGDTNPDTYRMRVDLARKHPSKIEYFVEFESDGAEPVVGLESFDLDNTAEIHGITLRTDDDPNNSQAFLFWDIKVDEDVTQVKVEYSSDGGANWITENDGPFDFTNKNTISGQKASNFKLDNGDVVDVRFTPQDANGNKNGIVERRTIFWNAAGWIKETNRFANTINGVNISLGEVTTDSSAVGLETKYSDANGNPAFLRMTQGYGGNNGIVELTAARDATNSGSKDTYVSIGNNGQYRSTDGDMGITIKQKGNLIFETNEDGAKLGNLDVVNTLTMGTDGEITTSSGDYTIDSSGISVQGFGLIPKSSGSFSEIDKAYTIKDGSTAIAALYGVTPDTMYLENVEGSIDIIAQSGDSNQTIFLRSSQIDTFDDSNAAGFVLDNKNGDFTIKKQKYLSNANSPSQGVSLYVYEDSSGNLELRAIFPGGLIRTIAQDY